MARPVSTEIGRPQGSDAVRFAFASCMPSRKRVEVPGEGRVDDGSPLTRRSHLFTQLVKDGRSKIATWWIEQSGDVKQGIKPEDLLSLPDTKFFRKRGPEEIIFLPFDVRGQLLTEDGTTLSPDGYLDYLSTTLPSRFIGSREYNKYVDQMREHYAAKS